jgi:hypothetical protein
VEDAEMPETAELAEGVEIMNLFSSKKGRIVFVSQTILLLISSMERG